MCAVVGQGKAPFSNRNLGHVRPMMAQDVYSVHEYMTLSTKIFWNLVVQHYWRKLHCCLFWSCVNVKSLISLDWYGYGKAISIYAHRASRLLWSLGLKKILYATKEGIDLDMPKKNACTLEMFIQSVSLHDFETGDNLIHFWWLLFQKSTLLPDTFKISWLEVFICLHFLRMWLRSNLSFSLCPPPPDLTV